ncbi:MAG: hypothetical protein OSJ72_16320 [Lachnospiraceae bacterium]|nr:hypothetical protein [Lachnospiraceae bacterium]
MKKIVSVLLTTAMVITMAGCGGDKATPAPAAETPAAEAPAADTQAQATSRILIS